jgi:AraC-like DNA-binding protein
LRYQELEPTAALRGRVRYWRLEGVGTGGAAEPVLPDGCVELVVHLGDPFWIERGGERARQPRVLCAGPGTLPVRLAPERRIDVIGVRLEAGVASELLEVPVGELVDRLPALDEVAPRLARGWAEELAAARDTAGVQAVLDRRIAPRLAQPAAPTRALGAAVARVRARGGRVRVDDLAREHGLSTRQLERLFAQHVGLGPKTFARLVRFQRALGLARRPRARLAEVAAAAGYYDQAHLVRDFQRFAGASPSRALASELGLGAHFVDAAPSA